MNTILEMRGIEKTFPGVKALNNVNLVVRTGEIHAIVGEIGAGKSTLMKVLSGVYPHGSYSGDIVYQGQTRAFKDIVDSESVGIIIIHQELALVPLLSITENLFLGNEQARCDRLGRFLRQGAGPAGQGRSEGSSIDTGDQSRRAQAAAD